MQTDHCVLYKVSLGRIKGPRRHTGPGDRMSSSALCHRIGPIYAEFGQREFEEEGPYIVAHRVCAHVCM